MELVLSDMLTKDAVLEKAFSHPAVKVTPRTRNKPGIEQANKVVLNAIEFCAIEHAAAQARQRFTDILEEHTMTYGPFEDAEKAGTGDEWTNEIDERIENACFTAQKYLSADWMGRNTIDCGLHEENGVEKLAMSYGKEIYKNVTFNPNEKRQMTPEEILDAAGVLDVDIEQALHAHLNQTPEEKTNMALTEEEQLKALADKLSARLGKDFDMIVVSTDIDLASDDDEALALGALQRLGLDEADGLTLQTARMTYGGEDLPDTIFNLMNEEPEKAPRKAPVKGAAAVKKAVAKKGAKNIPDEPEDESAQLEGDSSLSHEVLQILSEAGGAKDTDMADALGVARATYNNYRAGKSIFEPSIAQHQAVRAQVLERANKLLAALGMIDGVQPYVLD